MNKNTEKIVQLIIPLLTVFIVLSMILVFFTYLSADITKKEFTRYNVEYKIKTGLVGNWYRLKEKVTCKVLKQDGTKVNLEDFNIAVFKVPMEVK